MPKNHISIRRDTHSTLIQGRGDESMEILRGEQTCDVCDLTGQKDSQGFYVRVRVGDCGLMVCGGCISKEWLRIIECRMEADTVKEVSDGREAERAGHQDATHGEAE